MNSGDRLLVDDLSEVRFIQSVVVSARDVYGSMQESPPHKRFLLYVVYRIRLFTFFRATRRTPHGASRAWCKQCLPVRCKPGVPRPGIVGMRGAVVMRLITTVIHDKIS